MRTNEFIKKVKGLGFDILSHYDCIDIGTDAYNTIAVVSVDKILAVDTDWSVWHDLSKIQKVKLFDLLVEYAKTPIEEREEPKKYYLRHKWMGHEKLKYLELDTQNDEWYLGHKYDTIFVTAKNEFTHEEIDEIKEKYKTDLSDFEIVEVEE